MTLVPSHPQPSNGNRTKKMIEAMKRIFLFLLLLLPATSASAQAVPKNEVAEFTFERGLELYRQQEYNLAYQRFSRVVSDFPLNQKTTAAMLMGARALFSQGMFKESIELVNQLLSKYPDSRYVSDASRLKSMASGQNNNPQQPQVFNLGIALPLKASDTYVRALFNGIRIAVEDYNNSRPRIPVKMVFRDSGGELDPAQIAMTSLIRDGKVGAVIGPLFSQEALSAAEVADRSQVVMVAPVATESRVSDGKRYVFQASSTFTMRGQLMARYAVSDLGYKNVGVAYESNSQNEQTVQSFTAEVRRLGGTVVFSKALTSASEWAKFGRSIPATQLAQAQAIYMPINGRDAARNIESALTSLDQVRATNVVLGNSDWHDLSNADLASRYRAAYTSDFWVSPTDPRVQEFARKYQSVTGQMPDELGLSHAGYDLTNFLITQIRNTPEGSSLQQQIRTAIPFDGLGRRYDFRNGNQNQAVFYLRYRNGLITLDR